MNRAGVTEAEVDTSFTGRRQQQIQMDRMSRNQQGAAELKQQGRQLYTQRREAANALTELLFQEMKNRVAQQVAHFPDEEKQAEAQQWYAEMVQDPSKLMGWTDSIFSTIRRELIAMLKAESGEDYGAEDLDDEL